MTEYVLGFMFSLDCKRVVLIEKTKPDWQKGKLNGVGGKIENGETPEEAMQREFREETGVDWPFWDKCFEMGGEGWFCHVFQAVSSQIDQCKSMTEEQVSWVYTDAIPTDRVIFNLRWIIPMLMDLPFNEREADEGQSPYHLFEY